MLRVGKININKKKTSFGKFDSCPEQKLHYLMHFKGHIMTKKEKLIVYLPFQLSVESLLRYVYVSVRRNNSLLLLAKLLYTSNLKYIYFNNFFFKIYIFFFF